MTRPPPPPRCIPASLDEVILRLFSRVMGHRNPDRVPLAYRRARCETVGAMRRDAWNVISRCEKCGLMMGVDLARVIRERGPHVSLWNRRAICRRLGCRGSVSFLAKVQGMASHEPLEARDD